MSDAPSVGGYGYESTWSLYVVGVVAFLCFSSLLTTLVSGRSARTRTLSGKFKCFSLEAGVLASCVPPLVARTAPSLTLPLHAAVRQGGVRVSRGLGEGRRLKGGKQGKGRARKMTETFALQRAQAELIRSQPGGNVSSSTSTSPPVGLGSETGKGLCIRCQRPSTLRCSRCKAVSYCAISPATSYAEWHRSVSPIHLLETDDFFPPLSLSQGTGRESARPLTGKPATRTFAEHPLPPRLRRDLLSRRSDPLCPLLPQRETSRRQLAGERAETEKTRS